MDCLKRNEIQIPFFEKIISNETFSKIQPAIGGGGCGKVFKVSFNQNPFNEKNELINFDESKKYVMKKFKDIRMKYILREIGFQNSLNHPFIMDLSAWVGFYKTYEHGRIKFSPRLVMPLAELGTLEKCVKENFDQWSQTEKYKLIYSICRSIWFLHKLNVFHRDIKPINILIMKDKTPRIADFGFTKIKENNDENSISFKAASFLAPESYTMKSSYPADVFSLSLCLYEIFECESVTKYFCKKMKGKIAKASTVYSKLQNRPLFTEKTPDIWIKMISSMWCVEPLKRVTMDYVINEIENEQYYIEGSDRNEIKRFIEGIKKEEEERYFLKSNETLKYLKKADKFYRFGKSSFLRPFKLATPVIVLINQFYDKSARYREPDFDDNDQHCNEINNVDNSYTQSIPKTSNLTLTKGKNSSRLMAAKYEEYILLFNKMIHGLHSLSLINDFDAQMSIASYCIFELNDYMSAYSILKNCEKLGSKDGQSLVQLMLLEAKKSNLAKAMMLEAQGKYQDAIDAYFDCIENGKIDFNALGRLGRVLAVFGENNEVRKEGLKMMENAASFGDHFSAFHLGYIYYKKASDDKQDIDTNIKKAIECFNMADNFSDIDLMLFKCYNMINDKKNKRQYQSNVDKIYYENII